MPERYKNHWRLIIDPPEEGPLNMAVDEALLHSAEGEDFLPAFRIYGWKRPTVSIGYLQDPAPFLSAGLPLVRRITGGRAVLHHREITYSIVCRSGSPLYCKGISGAYLIISRAITAALMDMGLDASLARTRPGPEARSFRACFRSASRHEVLLKGKKVVGSAQRRFKNGLLQHGSILLDIDRAMTKKLFGSDALSFMTSIYDHLTAFDEKRFVDALVRRMAGALGAVFVKAPLTETESRLKALLMEKKYSCTAWTLSKAEVRLEPFPV